MNHELYVRGFKDVGEFDTPHKVQILKNNIEKKPKLKWAEELNPESELLFLKLKVTELSSLFLEWRDELGVRSKRIPSLFLNCAGRIRRSLFSDPKLYPEFETLGKQLMDIKENCEEMYEVQFPTLS